MINMNDMEKYIQMNIIIVVILKIIKGMEKVNYLIKIKD